MDVVLSDRALNRATLSRQLLLERRRVPALEVIELLVGLQGQDPELPYVGLWNRIDGFAQAELTGLLADRAVARATLFRGTQHLLSTPDYRWIRPLLQPMLDRMRRTAFQQWIADVDHAELAAEARRVLGTSTMTRPELGRALVRRWPQHEGVWLARAAQVALPVLHPYPDGTWGRRGPTPFVLAEHWLDEPFDRERELSDLVLRYLAGFGPASVMDMQAWSGLTRLRAVFDRLRPRLRTYRSAAGTELFDLPDRPLPDPETPAPVRFLAGFDNVTFGYADRTRIIADAHRPYLVSEAALTVDGTVRGVWKLSRGELSIGLFAPLTGAEEDAVRTEADALLSFAEPDTALHRVLFRNLS
jgi:hypothetical protein